MGKRYFLVEVDEYSTNNCDEDDCKKCLKCLNIVLPILGFLALVVPWYIFAETISLTEDDIVEGNITLSYSFTELNEGTTIEEELIIIKVIIIINSILGTIELLLIFSNYCCLNEPVLIIIAIANVFFIVLEIVIFALLVVFKNKLEEVTLNSPTINTMKKYPLTSAILAIFIYYELCKLFAGQEKKS